MSLIPKAKAIELIDAGVSNGLGSFFLNQVAVLVTKDSKDARIEQHQRLIAGLDMFFWAREQAVKAIEEGKISGVE
jgi:hypothetical protein